MTVVPICRLTACRSSRRGASSTWSVDSPLLASDSLIGAASRPARQSQQASSVSDAAPRPAACRGGLARGARVRAAARKDRRIHEEMDWGAAACEKNGRKTPRSAPCTTIHQNQDDQPETATRRATPKTAPKPGCRGSYVPKASTRSDKISQEALTAEALSETD